MTSRPSSPPAREAGYSLIELMIVLMVLAIGILAIAKLLPKASGEQVRDRMRTSASYFAQEKIETLRGSQYNDPIVQPGRHPVAGEEAVGPKGTLDRYYNVTDVPEPLNNLRLAEVIVRWQTGTSPDSVVARTYVDR